VLAGVGCTKGLRQRKSVKMLLISLQTLPGPYPSKVDSLAFVIRHPDDLTEDDIPSQLDLRLFSSGGGSELVEWDLEKSCIRVRYNISFFNRLLIFSVRELLARKEDPSGQLRRTPGRLSLPSAVRMVQSGFYPWRTTP